MPSNLLGSATFRLTGIASGLDTETIVSDLMRVNRLKVDAAEQKKQILEWKAEQYQEILTALYQFQNKYAGSFVDFGTDAAKPKAISDSPFVTAAVGDNAFGDIYIHDILSVASPALMTSGIPVSADPKIEIVGENLNEIGGKSITVSLDGKEKTLTFAEKTYESAEDVCFQLQSLLDWEFGEGRINVLREGGTMTLHAQNSELMLKTPADGSVPASLLFESFSFNRIDMNVSLAFANFAEPIEGDEISFVINSQTFSFSAGQSLNAIISNINNSDAGVRISYSPLTDTFTMVSAETGKASKVEIADLSGGLLTRMFPQSVRSAGTDAVIKLSPNGFSAPEDAVIVTRSSNTLEVNGVRLTVNGMLPEDGQEQISIKLSRDDDALTEKIKAFVGDYNSLLDRINTKLTEEYDGGYPPLTAEQKKEMSDSEIELWTKKAKTGLLENDSYLRNIQSQLRSVFYTAVNKACAPGETGSASILGALSEIGISTKDYGAKGRLTFDEGAFRNALSAFPEKVFALLNQKSALPFSVYTLENQEARFAGSGAFERLDDLLKLFLNKSGSNKGALITLVGSPSDLFSGKTEYTDRVKKLNDKITEMNIALTAREDRYWAMFTAMETALSKLNQQSMWIAGLMNPGNR